MESFEEKYVGSEGEEPKDKPEFLKSATSEEEQLIYEASVGAMLKAENGTFKKEKYSSQGEKRIRVKNEKGELLLDYSEPEYEALLREASHPHSGEEKYAA